MGECTCLGWHPEGCPGDPPTLKRCPRCKLMLTAIEFYNSQHGRRGNGLSGYCKKCAREDTKRRRS